MGDNRLAGFFWEKDVFKKDYLSSSNEKLMVLYKLSAISRE